MRRFLWFVPFLFVVSAMAQVNTRGGPSRASNTTAIIPTCVSTTGSCPSNGYVCMSSATLYRCTISGGWGTVGGPLTVSPTGASYTGDVTADSFTVRTKDDGKRYRSLAANTIDITDTVTSGVVAWYAKGAAGSELPYWKNATYSPAAMVIGTGSSLHGVTLWGVVTATDATFDTGTEVCVASGLTCVTTFDVLGTPIGCGTVHTSFDGWLANCK